MAIYELTCPSGHRHEIIQSFTAPLPPCPACGAPTSKVPSTFGFAGSAKLPPPPEAMPQTWRGTYHGDREYVTELRRTAEARRRLEEANPELVGDRRPILAHEGRYEQRPLRAGDPVPAGFRRIAPHGHSHARGCRGGPAPGPAEDR
ncbi:zinc ribbon domain-containing protein [Streptomyces sp. NBC_00879]|uniref:FmdB family zinc ribbon protein n=1 Tax=Streptomyces sp. NBC_00879 TaxID=2975855 RepID=UPI0038707BEE|nr:zinc ribbon domain-containing protein [Streptomyces sp. NBC_00879]